MEQLVNASLPPQGSFGALLRARRHGAYLSQEQLAARAELSERTVRNLEAGRVRAPRMDTVRLLAEALELSELERESWFEAARGVNHQQAEPAVPGAGGQLQPPNDPLPLPLTARAFGVEYHHRRHGRSTAAFTAEIVELCQREDRWRGRAAEEVCDLAEMAPRTWAGPAGQGAGTRGDCRLTCAERRELTKLRLENRRLRQDVEILKRAAAIVATDTW